MFPLFSLWLQEILSWPPVFSHRPSTSPCPSFDEDKQDESLLAENWGPRSWTTRWGRGWRRGETRELELLELQSDTNLAFLPGEPASVHGIKEDAAQMSAVCEVAHLKPRNGQCST